MQNNASNAVVCKSSVYCSCLCNLPQHLTCLHCGHTHVRKQTGECVKKGNSFLRKGIHGGNHGTWFSAEPGNLYNKHSYKFSGGSRGQQ